MADVVVAGAGPAGWAVARACAERGLRTVLVAPHPAASWPATYGLWLDEASLLPAGARYVVARARVVAGSTRWLARRYAVLDNASVRAALGHPGVSVRAGRLEDVLDLAPVVIDATGAPAGRVEQTAFGVKVAAAVARPVVGAGEAVFMDWRQPLPGPATFLYAVPLPDGRVLLEETSLARRPGLPFGQLRERLLARLATHGIDPGDAEVERVRFPLDTPPPTWRGFPRPSSRAHAYARCPAPTRSRGAPLTPFYRWGVTKPLVVGGLWTASGCEWRVVPFGAAAGLVHPATGYGIGEVLRLAPRVADAVVRGGATAASRVVWSARARAVHGLRRAGLGTVLALAPEEHAAFFELFFALPEHRQRAYLSGREDLAGNASAMAAMFGAAPWSLRRRMALRR